MLYFAYGSNTHPGQMAVRCPTAVDLGPAILSGYALVERLHADIARDPRGHVLGILWDLQPPDVEALDIYEGVAGGYYQHLTVTVQRGRWPSPRAPRATALTYIMTPRAVCRRHAHAFTPSYAATCAHGFTAHALPVPALYRRRLSS